MKIWMAKTPESPALREKINPRKKGKRNVDVYQLNYHPYFLLHESSNYRASGLVALGTVRGNLHRKTVGNENE